MQMLNTVALDEEVHQALWAMSQRGILTDPANAPTEVCQGIRSRCLGGDLVSETDVLRSILRLMSHGKVICQGWAEAVPEAGSVEFRRPDEGWKIFDPRL